MSRTRRRHNTGFGYMGFGNNINVFNRKPSKAFSQLKDKLNEETHFHFQLNFTHKSLTKAEKNIIKNKIRKDERTRRKKTIIVTSIVLILISIFIKLSIDNIMSRI